MVLPDAGDAALRRVAAALQGAGDAAPRGVGGFVGPRIALQAPSASAASAPSVGARAAVSAARAGVGPEARRSVPGDESSSFPPVAPVGRWGPRPKRRRASEWSVMSRIAVAPREREAQGEEEPLAHARHHAPLPRRPPGPEAHLRRRSAAVILRRGELQSAAAPASAVTPPTTKATVGGRSRWIPGRSTC